MCKRGKGGHWEKSVSRTRSSDRADAAASTGSLRLSDRTQMVLVDDENSTRLMCATFMNNCRSSAGGIRENRTERAREVSCQDKLHMIQEKDTYLADARYT